MSVSLRNTLRMCCYIYWIYAHTNSFNVLTWCRILLYIDIDVLIMDTAQYTNRTPEETKPFHRSRYRNTPTKICMRINQEQIVLSLLLCKYSYWKWHFTECCTTDQYEIDPTSVLICKTASIVSSCKMEFRSLSFITNCTIRSITFTKRRSWWGKTKYNI